MKKKSILRKIVNLSPLVDVFMIVIFWYIMFSNQNLQNQEENAQNVIEGLQQEVGGLENSLEKLEMEKKASDDYIKELLEEVKSLREELEEMKKVVAPLETENEKLTILLEQEGQCLVLRLLDGTNSRRTLEVTYEGEQDYIVFKADELMNMQNKLEAMVSKYLKNNSRLNVLFLYEREASFIKDVTTIDFKLNEMKKEQYFTYIKMDLSVK